jgi:adenylate cyclase
MFRAVLDREWPWGLLAVALTTGLWVLDPAGLVSRGRERAFESMGVLFTRSTEANSRVTVIDIDRESISRLGPWPWRRGILADLIDRSSAAGARAIGIDILLAGADRKGPAALARELTDMVPTAGIDASAFDDDDQRLSASIAGPGNVVLGLILDDAGTDAPPFPAPLSLEGTTEGIAPRGSAGLLAPNEAFSLGAAATGILSLQDGILGRVTSAPVLAVGGGEVFAGFAVETARVAEQAPLFVLKNAPNRIELGAVSIPIDANAEMRLHYSSPTTWPARTIPAWQVLAEDGGAGERLRDRIVLIGSSAPEAGAFLPVPGAPLAPTVQIQAEAVEQILSGRSVMRPADAIAWETAAMALLGLVSVGIAIWFSPGWAAATAIALIGAWIAGTIFAFLADGLLLDPLGAPLAIILGGNVTAFAGFIRTRALKTAITSKFERYVPPEVVARLVREPEALRLDGELKEVTALLCDVEGFSGMTERSDPRLLVRTLDAYFDLVTELIVGHGGMVDKIVGDAVLAFFNIPAPLAGHTDAAVRCALAIVASTDEFRRGGDAAALGFGRTRVGIEFGTAIVGDVGGRRRLDYTAYGVVVNKAARFQDANKALKSSICIGPDAVAKLSGEIKLRALGRIAVRGMTGLAEVCEPWLDSAPPEFRERYAEAVAAHESDPERARDMLRTLSDELPDDPVVRMWLDRLSV